MIYWSVSHGILDCGGPIGPVQRCVPWTTNITFHTWFFYSSNFFYYIIQVGRSLIYSGSPLVYSLLDVVGFSYYFFGLSASFWATITRTSVWESLLSLLYHLLEVSWFLCFFRALYHTWFTVKYLSYSHSLLLVSVQSLKNGNDEAG